MNFYSFNYSRKRCYDNVLVCSTNIHALKPLPQQNKSTIPLITHFDKIWWTKWLCKRINLDRFTFILWYESKAQRLPLLKNSSIQASITFCRIACGNYITSSKFISDNLNGKKSASGIISRLYVLFVQGSPAKTCSPYQEQENYGSKSQFLEERCRNLMTLKAFRLIVTRHYLSNTEEFI